MARSKIILIKNDRAKKYQDRVENRLCVWCSTPLPKDHNGALCDECAKKNRERSKETREWCLSHNICPVCRKNKIYPPERSCPNCKNKANQAARDKADSDMRRERAKQRRAARRAAGLCSCGRELEPGYRMCERCRRKQRNRRKTGEWTKREERSWQGICKCGSDDMQEGTKLCKRCYAIACENLAKGRETLKQKRIQEQIDRGILLIDPPLVYNKRKLKQPVVYPQK